MESNDQTVLLIVAGIAIAWLLAQRFFYFGKIVRKSDALLTMAWLLSDTPDPHDEQITVDEVEHLKAMCEVYLQKERQHEA